MLSAGVSLLGYKLASETISYVRFDHPEIVFDPDKDPATVIPGENGEVYIETPENLESEDLLLVSNRFGRPDIAYKKKQLVVKEDGNYSFELPETNDPFAYTLYSREDDNLNYLGESNPLVRSGSGFEQKVADLTEGDYREPPMSRKRKRGHYKIEILSNGTEVEYPISYQKREMSGRILGYGKSKSHSENSVLLKSLGESIVSQSGAETEYEKLVVLTEFVQRMEWKDDVRTTGKFEYIREPAKTMVNLYGDCKDRTVINNGLISNTLDIETVIMFCPGHMFTGIDYDDLNDNTIENLRENAEGDEVATYNGTDSKYVAVDSTSHHNIGIEYPATIYALYTDHYEIRDIKGLYNHMKKTFSVARNGDYSAL